MTETAAPARVIYSISELNQMVRSLLEDAFPPLWVEGEISNFSCPSSGHWYFTLKDSASQIRCAMFQGRNRALGFQPSNGMQILMRGKISLYEARGDFQMVADYMEEAGDGVLRRAFELLKTRLAQEGLFEPIHKKPLPHLPRTIGVITSPTGAAVRDILTVLKRRFANIPIIIYPTAVQGNNAETQIIHAIQTANKRKECDVLILARGGGSLEDLWSFNLETVARAVFASEIPIVSAIGHEIDFTIADFVADCRAPTPSAAAELVSPDRNAWLQQINKLHHSLCRQVQNQFQQLQNAYLSLSKRLRHPGQRLHEQSQTIDNLEKQLLRAIHNKLQTKQQHLTELTRALEAISPLATLARGYAIVTTKKEGEIVYNASQVKAGDIIKTQLSEGFLTSIVHET